MRPEQKILTGALWLLAVLAMVCVVGAKWWTRHGDSAGAELYAVDEPLATLPDFSLVDQDNHAVTRATLAGHPYLADFIYTHCMGPCPLMTEKMSRLARDIPDIHFVTVSVDPTNDTPQVLKDYAKAHHADESRWHFLTGKPENVYALARGMLLTAQPATPNSPILHSEKFVLVDSAGRMRKVYDSNDPDQMTHIPADAKKLVNESK